MAKENFTINIGTQMRAYQDEIAALKSQKWIARALEVAMLEQEVSMVKGDVALRYDGICYFDVWRGDQIVVEDIDNWITAINEFMQTKPTNKEPNA